MAERLGFEPIKHARDGDVTYIMAYILAYRPHTPFQSVLSALPIVSRSLSADSESWL